MIVAASTRCELENPPVGWPGEALDQRTRQKKTRPLSGTGGMRRLCNAHRAQAIAVHIWDFGPDHIPKGRHSMTPAKCWRSMTFVYKISDPLRMRRTAGGATSPIPVARRNARI